jgi:glycopeptide antibiotics resistance protein
MYDDSCTAQYNYKVVWILWVVLIVVATTLPWTNFHFHVDHGKLDRVVWIPFQGARLSKRGIVDIADNIFLFIPFSYLYLRSLASHHFRGLVTILLASVLLSVTIEGVQLFNTSRFTSMTDVVTNIIGAFLGAGFFLLWRRKRAHILSP